MYVLVLFFYLENKVAVFVNMIYLAFVGSWETYMQVRKQQLELDMDQQTGSK